MKKNKKNKTVKNNKLKNIFKKFKKTSYSSVISVLILIVISGVFLTLNVLFVGNLNNELIDVSASIEQTKIIQKILLQKGYYEGQIDGFYDYETQTSVIDFQKDNNLNQTGYVDSNTAIRLGLTNVATQNTDIDLLARLIHSEARGEPYIGQVAVGAVVLNRIKSSKFPNTMYEVIYQPFAFTAVDDGQINLEPNEAAYQAAEDALAGWDPSYGSLFYYNPQIATSSWIFTRETVIEIGKHIFAI